MKSLFLVLLFLIFLNPFSDFIYKKVNFLILITFCFSIFISYFSVEFDNQALSIFFSSNSIFLAISIFLKNSKLLKISVLNFLFVLNNFFINVLNLNLNLIVFDLTLKQIFTFLITASILMFLFELINVLDKLQEK